MVDFKKSTTAFLFVFSSILAYSQYKVEGYIINKTKDTVWGTVNIKKKKKTLDLQSLFKGVTFYSKSLRIEMEYRTEEILGFGIRSDNLTDDYVSPEAIGEKSKDIFYRRLVSGNIQIFDLENKRLTSEHGYDGRNYYKIKNVHEFYIKLNGQKLKMLEGDDFIFKKDYLQELFQNHPELLVKIDGDKDIAALEEIITEYNKKYPIN